MPASAALLLFSLAIGTPRETPAAEAPPSPLRFAEQIEAFKDSDAAHGFPTKAIVVIGSSSIRMWHPTIAEDLAPLTVIPRGFGGSTMVDALFYMDRIVLPYKPRAVVIYEGDNDIARGTPPSEILDQFNEFVGRLHEALPDTRVYFLSIKPSISRWSMWADMSEANRLIAEACAADDRLAYVDVAAGMLGDDGKPLPHIFRADNLHMTRDGYIIWRDILRPVLMERELDSEKNVGAASDPGS